MTTETKTQHFWFQYGRVFEGYGSSMDPHRCGHPDEPCITVVLEREVSPWVEVSRVVKGDREWK